MKSVQLWTVDGGRLVADQHLAAVIKRVDDHCAGVAQSDLEDGPAVLSPPAFAGRGMILAEFEQMPGYGDGTWYLGQSFNVWDVGMCYGLNGINY